MHKCLELTSAGFPDTTLIFFRPASGIVQCLFRIQTVREKNDIKPVGKLSGFDVSISDCDRFQFPLFQNKSRPAGVYETPPGLINTYPGIRQRGQRALVKKIFLRRANSFETPFFGHFGHFRRETICRLNVETTGRKHLAPCCDRVTELRYLVTFVQQLIC